MHAIFKAWLQKKATRNGLSRYEVPYQVARHAKCGCAVVPPRTENMGWNSGEGPAVVVYKSFFVIWKGDVLVHLDCGNAV